MPIAIDRNEVRRLIEQDHAQVVEVLPREEYEWAHLAGALNVPLKHLDRQTVSGLDRARPVIVYCNDFQCDISPRAAWRLERLGFPPVYDYVPGKMDWLSFGLPHEGSAILAGDSLRRDIPRCTLDEKLGDVRARLEAHGDTACIAVLEDDIVMGIVQGEALKGSPEERVEDMMEFGVTTVRPSEDLQALTERMRRARVEAIVVTSSDARLLGLLLREDAETAG